VERCRGEGQRERRSASRQEVSDAQLNRGFLGEAEAVTSEALPIESLQLENIKTGAFQIKASVVYLD
jgi:hypothetical protein